MSEIYKAIIEVQSKIEDVKRDTEGQVGNQKYNYATLDAVLEMLRPLLANNGLAVLQVPDGAWLKTKIIHKSGEVLECGEYPIGQHDKQQAIGSAITYGRRYALCAIFGISQVDDDGSEASKDKNPVFKNSAQRKAWCESLFKLFEDAITIDELDDSIEPQRAMLEKMKAGHEYDVVAYEETVQRYKRAKTRLKDEAQRLAAIKQQLGE
jgi:hypothetical protein